MKVLIGSDGSAGAREALDAVVSWPVRSGNTFAVASVSPTRPVIDAITEPARYLTWGEEFPKLAAEIAEGEAERLRDAGHEARAVVLTGDPAVALLHYANEKNFDLIVLGAQGTGAIGHFQLGSVTQRVAHHAACSVLAVRPQGKVFESMVIATDGSRSSFDAVDQLTALPLYPKLEARIIFVLPQPDTWIVIDDPEQRERMKALANELRAEFEGVADSVCDEIAKRMLDAGVLSQKIIAVGSPAAQIISHIESTDANLVVIGDQSRPDLASSLLGSVALAVLKGAPCSVFVGRNRIQQNTS